MISARVSAMVELPRCVEINRISSPSCSRICSNKCAGTSGTRCCLTPNSWRIFGDVIRITPTKTQGSTGKMLELPILAPLAVELELVATNEPTFLPTEYGQPFSAAGFGGWFKERVLEAKGVDPRATAHGLRKVGATLAANGGATTEMLKSMFGWTSSQMADVYVKAVNQKKLAAMGMPLLLSSIPLSDQS